MSNSLTLPQASLTIPLARMPHTLNSTPGSSDHFGTRLRLRRERFGMSISDVSAATNLRIDYIEAIERLDETALPAIGYSLGFVRTYAKVLGMDGNVAVKEYKADIALTKVPLRDAPHVILRRQLRLPRGFLSALSVASVALMVGLWYGTQSEAIAAPATTPLTAQPNLAELAPAAPILSDDLFTLRTTAPSWVKVTDANGTTLISRIFVTGETWQGPTNGGYRVSVRDAGAVELYHGARLVGPLGAAGEPIDGLTLSLN
jgi:cytoskeleton protein RodZ